MRPSPEDVETKLRNLLQMADIMNALMERCETEVLGLRQFIKPGVDLADMTGLSLAIFQSYEIRGRVNELCKQWEDVA